MLPYSQACPHETCFRRRKHGARFLCSRVSQRLKWDCGRHRFVPFGFVRDHYASRAFARPGGSAGALSNAYLASPSSVSAGALAGVAVAGAVAARVAGVEIGRAGVVAASDAGVAAGCVRAGGSPVRPAPGDW